MSAALTLGLVGGLLILAFVSNRVYRLTRIPDVVVLMALGVLLGPVLGLVNAASLSRTTSLLGTLAIILVLFEGGLELDLRETLRHFSGSLLLAFVAYVFSTVLVTVIITQGLGLSWTAGLLVGAALGCTSSTVVLPVLQQMDAEEPVRVTLMLEASWGDVLAVLTVGLLISIKGGQGGVLASGLVRGILLQVGVALAFAGIAGILWARLLPVVSEQRFWQVLTFSIVLVLYAGMEAVGANGLIAVLGFGLTLANYPGINPDLLGGVGTKSHQSLLDFHSELAFLVRTFFFVLIGAIAQLDSFRKIPLLMAGTLAALFVARWLAVHTTRWTWKGIGEKGRETILWMLPRGLITVVLALQVTEARGAELAFLPGLAFAIILATNVMVVLGSLRAGKPAVAGAMPAGADILPADGEASPLPVIPNRRRRWAANAALLVLLAVGGVMLWYGNLASEKRPATFREWIQLHLPH